jgi:hypothetical protein
VEEKMEESLRDELDAPQWVHGLTSCGLAFYRDNVYVNKLVCSANMLKVGWHLPGEGSISIQA